MKKLIPIVALLLFSCGNSGKNDGNPTPAKQIQAPGFALKSIDGKTVKLEDHKGKVVLLDFWATWCPPCRMSTPEAVKLYNKMKDKNFTVLSISLDEEVDAVPTYAAKERIPYPVLYADEAVQRDYQVRGIPLFVLIDQKGAVVKRYDGYSPALPREWENQIAKLLQ